MEQLVGVARELREVHDFRGYIHLKTIPDASPELLEAAGRLADRVSVNIELPIDASVERLAPQKDPASIRRSMARLREQIDQYRGERVARFAPGGQSTQMIVGADDASDQEIIAQSVRLYSSYRLRRVYYSAYSPIPDASSTLPPKPAPLLREHRLYQADWLLRHYEFSADELFTTDRMLPLDVDPKLAWALAHRERFPIDLNRASREDLLRVPGLGTRAVARILAARKVRRIHVDHLRQLRVPLRRVLPFVQVVGHVPARGALDGPRASETLRETAHQLTLDWHA
jgi:predicted DNA-binding helix-hairpin-helix protein